MIQYQNTPRWSSTDRMDYIEKAKDGAFDVIIVGGGITGAGIARELALRGYRFIILDKVDFAFGTSSRSSKLIHGGMRYMANGQFEVTRESCTERNWLRSHFPNLVRPERFYMVSYDDKSSISPKKTKFALNLYNSISDKASKFKNFAKPGFLTRDEILKEVPNLNQDKLLMAGYGYENNVDDARLTLETIKEALIYSEQSIALNHAKVESFILTDQGKAIGVNVKDVISGDTFEVKGTQVVNATGIWTDELLKEEAKLIRPSKGVHVIIPNERIGTKQMFSIRSPEDGRAMFILRREKFTVIGTTDTDYSGDLDNPVCNNEEFEYMIKGANIMFPDANITKKDIISTYAGIRPLVVDPNAKSEGEVSRKHVIIDHPNGVVSMIGGKLTIYRKMGEELVYHLIRKHILPKPKQNGKMMKHGYSKVPFLVGLTREEFDSLYAKGLESKEYPELDADLLEYLFRQYGKQAFDIMKIIKEDPEKGTRFYEGEEFIPADVEWICDHEFSPRLLDMICRRTEMSLYVHHSHKEDLAKKVGLIMQKKYGWSESQLNEEIQTYVDHVNSWLWF